MIRMKLTWICEHWKILSHGQRVLNSNGKISCFKNKLLNFSWTKKISNESFLTFRELQPLVSYKRVFCKKNTCTGTAWRVSKYGDFSGPYFPHSDWIRRGTDYLSVFSPNEGKYGPEKTLPYSESWYI